MKNAKMLTFRNLIICPEFHQIFYNGEELQLTKKEFQIFVYLFNYRECTLSFRQIYSNVWGKEFEDAEPHVLWQHMVRSRKNLTVFRKKTATNTETSNGKKRLSSKQGRGVFFCNICRIM